ncbi:MAG: trypsin-like peptidase domain-containing protein [Kiritimatiellae bacterium]|nr:trypsin-like peptidase domain-containing protein [Kiritimatiellia bacterium]
MRLHKTMMAAVAALALAGCARAQAEEPIEEDEGNDFLNAVVKLEVQTSEPDFVHPWRIKTGGSDGSGVVIAPGHILTCAHCVADTTFIRVRKNNEDSFYHAKPLFVDHARDLAIISVEDTAFMTDVTPMEIGETPPVQSEVVAVGFPIGGRLISFTRGIVSRIEEIRYAHGWTDLLAAQVDAAINPGNSGGPVLDMATGKIAGIAFQGNKRGEALGYMIPTDVIRCFLKDVSDKRVDGVPDHLFAVEELESEAARRYLKMAKGQTGLHIAKVAPEMGTNSLQAGDVLLEVDGIRVANNGDIRLPGNRIRTFFHPFQMRQIGDKVTVKVLRDGKILEREVPVAKRAFRARGFLYDEKPDYFVCGGLVFTTLSYSYILDNHVEMHDELADESKVVGDEQFVIISDVLADVCVEGYIGSAGVHVRSVNGEKVRNLRHLVELVDGAKGEFLRFGVDDNHEWDSLLVLDLAALREATPRIMERYRIPADRSEDLKAK